MLSPTIPPGINYLPTFPTPCACSETPITWSLDLGNLVICLHNAVFISQMQTKGRGWNCEVPRNMIWISLWGEIVWEYAVSFLVLTVVFSFYCVLLFAFVDGRYMMIEEKLKLSQYLPWTFVSCNMGLRKPDKRVYLEATRQLKVDPSHCIFIDDRYVQLKAQHNSCIAWSILYYSC
jgi:hypothetical protein